MSEPSAVSVPVEPSEPAAASRGAPAGTPADPTDRPIPLWPEGLLAAAAGATLLWIGLRHRAFLQRKAREAQRMVDEFQRQGGLDELAQVARQAREFLRGGG